MCGLKQWKFIMSQVSMPKFWNQDVFRIASCGSLWGRNQPMFLPCPLEVFSKPLCSLAHLQYLPPSSCGHLLCISMYSFLFNDAFIWFIANPNLLWFPLYLCLSNNYKDPISNKVIFWVSGWTWVSGKCYSTHLMTPQNECFISCFWTPVDLVI